MAHDCVSIVYKILTDAEWDSFQKDKIFEGNSIDKKDGFIHMCKDEQIDRIIDKYFKNDNVNIVSINATLLTDLRYEKNSFGDLYPHEYGNLKYGYVVGFRRVIVQHDIDS